MNKFSERSLANLRTAHPDLRDLAKRILERMDIAVICGYRSKAEQNEAFKKGNSKLKYPQSKHNRCPAMAIDICPYPIDWNDVERFKKMVRIAKEEAEYLGVDITCGADWNMRDYPHIQLEEIKR